MYYYAFLTVSPSTIQLSPITGGMNKDKYERFQEEPGRGMQLAAPELMTYGVGGIGIILSIMWAVL